MMTHERDIHTLPRIDESIPESAHLAEYFGAWAIGQDHARALIDRVRHMDWGQHVTTWASRPRAIAQPTQQIGSDDKTGTKIAIVPIRGTLMKQPSSLDNATSTVHVRRQVREATADASIGGIVLVIDSPGGTVSGTADLAADVERAAKQKPVIAFIEDLGASAAYWVASAADAVVANDRTALIGSIGTILVIYDVSAAAAKEGIEPVVISTGALKGTGVPGTQVTDDQRAYLQRVVDESNQSFITSVQSNRALSDEELARITDGRLVHAEEALELGLVDRIASLDDTLENMRRRIETSGDAKMTHPATINIHSAATDGETAEAPAPVADSERTTSEDVPTSDTTKANDAHESPDQEVTTLAQLRESCPGSTAEWRESVIDRGLTLDDAKTEHMAHLTERAERAERAAQEPRGGPPVPVDIDDNPKKDNVPRMGPRLGPTASAIRPAVKIRRE